MNELLNELAIKVEKVFVIRSSTLKLYLIGEPECFTGLNFLSKKLEEAINNFNFSSYNLCERYISYLLRRFPLLEKLGLLPEPAYKIINPLEERNSL